MSNAAGPKGGLALAPGPAAGFVPVQVSMPPPASAIPSPMPFPATTLVVLLQLIGPGLWPFTSAQVCKAVLYKLYVVEPLYFVFCFRIYFCKLLGCWRLNCSWNAGYNIATYSYRHTHFDRWCARHSQCCSGNSHSTSSFKYYDWSVIKADSPSVWMDWKNDRVFRNLGRRK